MLHVENSHTNQVQIYQRTQDIEEHVVCLRFGDAHQSANLMLTSHSNHGVSLSFIKCQFLTPDCLIQQRRANNRNHLHSHILNRASSIASFEVQVNKCLSCNIYSVHSLQTRMWRMYLGPRSVQFTQN